MYPCLTIGTSTVCARVERLVARHVVTVQFGHRVSKAPPSPSLTSIFHPTTGFFVTLCPLQKWPHMLTPSNLSPKRRVLEPHSRFGDKLLGIRVELSSKNKNGARFWKRWRKISHFSHGLLVTKTIVKNKRCRGVALRQKFPRRRKAAAPHLS